jgi:hypothetical protein
LPILKSTPYDGRTLNPAKKSKEASNEIITCNRIVSKVPQLQFEKNTIKFEVFLPEFKDEFGKGS